jgi:hypothetical protein
VNLILKRGNFSRSSGVGERPHGDIKRAAHGYEPTREAAMAAFAKSWRHE